MTSDRPKSTMTFPASGRTAQKSAKVTHESIQGDLERFGKAGGKIEKLGNTIALKKSEAKPAE
ncbi:hypothetical protein HF319_09305 [Xanthomonas sp. Kuri4-1]